MQIEPHANRNNDKSHAFSNPMISFCDIPLSLAKTQIKSYGKYGIGMSKEWGITNKLNPVVYIESQSLLAFDIQKSLDQTITLIHEYSNGIDEFGAHRKKFSTDILEKSQHYEKVSSIEAKKISRDYLELLRSFLENNQ